MSPEKTDLTGVSGKSEMPADEGTAPANHHIQGMWWWNWRRCMSNGDIKAVNFWYRIKRTRLSQVFYWKIKLLRLCKIWYPNDYSKLKGFCNSCSYCKVIIFLCCLTLVALHKRKSVLCKYEKMLISGGMWTFMKLFRVQKCFQILHGLYLISYYYYCCFYYCCYHYH